MTCCVCYLVATLTPYMSYMRYINKAAINNFTKLANSFRPTIKFTAEISDTETTFLDTCVYKGHRFKKHSILDVNTHFKPLETFQYTHFNSCHPPGVRKGFIKGEALRLLTKYTAVQCNQLAQALSVQSVSPCERRVSILGRFFSYNAEVFFMSTRKAVRYSVDIA